MRVLVVGGGGMLGHRVWPVLSQRFETFVTWRRLSAGARAFRGGATFVENVDATDFEGLTRVVEQIRPNVVINCVGVIKQLAAAKDPITSITTNSLVPHFLARACASVNARLIQISTDCVFSGRRGGYSERDVPDPGDLYGRSKLLGEVDAPMLTLRTSIIGRELSGANGLVEWFLSNRGQTVRGYTRVIFSGVTTIVLARTLAELVERDLSGLYHVAAQPIPKHDLLLMINEAFDARVTIEPDDSLVIDRSLDATAFRQATGLIPPSWPEMVSELARDGAVYEDWRRS